MVGFPGETGGAFSNTLISVKEILPARAHIFTFQQERRCCREWHGRGGQRASFQKTIPDAQDGGRLNLPIYTGQKFIDKDVEVLVEAKRDKQSGLLVGYSDNYIKMLFAGDDALMRRSYQLR